MDNNNKFWRGFLAGVLSTAGIAVIAGVFIIALNVGVKNDSLGMKNTYNLNTRLVGGDYEKSTLDYDHILTKMQFLQNIIDKYYLYGVDARKLEDMIYSGMLAGLDDVYTGYYNEEDYQALQESTTGIYYGIGVQVQQDTDTGVISITKVFSGGPSFEAGLRPEDAIYKIDDMEVIGMDLNTVVTYIKGSEGSTVNLTIYRASTKEYLEFEVERREVSIDTTTYNMIGDTIGYIQLTEFDEVSHEQFVEAYKDLESQGMEAMIVDVRGNPGGLLSSVVDILDEILPEGVLIYTEDKNGNGDTYTSDEERQINIPMAVLVNGNSASASEAFAGAIKDYGWGTIVGTTTFGKGIAQSMLPLGDGTAIKITESNYFTPSGNNIHGIGIEPDVVVELDEALKTMAVIDQQDDNQLQKAIEIVTEELNRGR